MKKILSMLLFSFIIVFFDSNVFALNVDNLLILDSYQKIQCGSNTIPLVFPQIVHIIIVGIQVIVPIIIILLGMIDLIKAFISQKEDEIKKGQQTFIRRIIIGMSIFLVIVLVKFLIGLVSPINENKNMWDCVECFINGNCTSLDVNN